MDNYKEAQKLFNKCLSRAWDDDPALPIYAYYYLNDCYLNLVSSYIELDKLSKARKILNELY